MDIKKTLASGLKKLRETDLPYIEKKADITIGFFKKSGGSPDAAVKLNLNARANLLQIALLLIGVSLCAGVMYLEARSALKRKIMRNIR